jgi:hypothetical protein
LDAQFFASLACFKQLEEANLSRILWVDHRIFVSQAAGNH